MTGEQIQAALAHWPACLECAAWVTGTRWRELLRHSCALG